MSDETSSTTGSVAQRRRRIAIALLLVVVSIAAFFPALDGQFLSWDDDVNLVRNTGYRGLDWSHLRWMATATVMGHYIPVTWLSFAVDHALWGMDARGYHLTNVVLHTAAVVAFFLVTLRLLGHATAVGAGARLLGATAAALFFAIHPLRVESVAWVTERRDVLCGVFVLLSLLAYLAATDAVTRRRRRLLMAASVVAFAAALGSKAIVMGFPLVLMVLDVYPLRRLELRRPFFARARAVLLEKIPFLIVAILGAGTAYYVVKTFTALTTTTQFPWPGRVAMIFYTLWFYATRTALPVGLSPLYELPAHVSLAQPGFLLPALAVVGITIVFVLARRHWPAGLAAWLCYAVFLAPVAGVVHAGFQLAHDRYSYLSCLGWAVVLGGIVAVLAGSRTELVSRAVRHVAVGAIAAWIVALGWLTWEQTHMWRTSYALWSAAIDTDPACALCHGNLAAELTNDDNLAGAIQHAKIALKLRPDRARPHMTIGIAYTKANRLDDAIVHFEKFLAAHPTSVEGLTSYGVALLRAGRPRHALSPLSRALVLDPRYVTARVNLAAVLVNLGARDAAMEQYRIALATAPDSGEARYGVGWAFAQFGDAKAARREQTILRTVDPRLAALLESEIARIR